jgi:hypothetical protein
MLRLIVTRLVMLARGSGSRPWAEDRRQGGAIEEVDPVLCGEQPRPIVPDTTGDPNETRDVAAILAKKAWR